MLFPQVAHGPPALPHSALQTRDLDATHAARVGREFGVRPPDGQDCLERFKRRVGDYSLSEMNVMDVQDLNGNRLV